MTDSSEGHGAEVEAAIARFEALLAAAADRLRAADARTEALARLAPPRGLARLMRREPRLAPAGRVWPLGVLLLDGDGRLFTVGRVVRATNADRWSFTAESQRERYALQRAAARGGVVAGDAVHVDVVAVDPRELVSAASASPLAWDGERFVVRWAAATAPADAERYLEERVALLVEPPARA